MAASGASKKRSRRTRKSASGGGEMDGPGASDLVDPNRRIRCSTLPALSGQPGIYGLYVASRCDTAWQELGVAPRDDGLLYIGVATDRLSRRYHPNARSCRNSSPRLSFGALLSNRLGLVMRPQPPAQRSHWQFDSNSEAKLAAWMRGNLAYAGFPWTAARHLLEAREAKLIVELKPPLNIKLLPCRCSPR